MNKENIQATMEVLNAILDGKKIQKRTDFALENTVRIIQHKFLWENVTPSLDVMKSILENGFKFYRIKPEPKKQSCRMYLVKSTIAKTGEPFYTAIASNSNVREIDDIESSPIFVRWLTDVIEYEIPE